MLRDTISREYSSEHFMKLFGNLLIALVLAASGGQALAQQQMDAADFDLSNYQGQVVYVDFWASWCTPCRASFPFMAEVAAEHGDDLAIVAVNVDESREDADAFLSDFDTPFDIVFDHSGALAGEFKVPGMPTSFLYDRQGQLIGQHIGFRKKDQEEIRQWIFEHVTR
jgi:YD repeat-containing protein